MDALLLVLITLFVFTQAFIFVSLSFNKDVKEKKKKLSKFYEDKSKELGLQSKPLSFFTLGILLYNPLTKKMKMNSYLLWTRPIQELYYILGRQIRIQASFQGRGSIETLKHLNKERSINFWFVGLLLMASVVGIYLQTQKLVSTEDFEGIQSLLNFPANSVLLYGLWRRFFSRSYKLEKIQMHKDLDSFSNEFVGGGSVYWERFLKKKKPKSEPCFIERHQESLKFPLKEELQK